MRHLIVVPAVFIALLLSPITAIAQSATDQSASIPRLITVTGAYRPADGTLPAAVETVTLSVYADQHGGAPLFQETQQVTLDDRGRYSVVLGAAHADGIPPAIFAAGAQWLGIVFERPGEVEGPRVRLTSVPYAMRAAEADTLGGRPASDYQLATTASGDTKSATAATRSDVAGPTGTTNFLPKYVDSVNFGDSVFYEAGGQIGLGTTTPFDIFHVRYTNTGGNLTGFAVQNMGNSATSYSGMLFYDQNNQLGQFQGFNNVTHEYRINNVARVTPGGAFNGSINFMLGGASKFIVAPNGNIGIGTTSPSAPLEVSNGLTPGSPASATISTYNAAPGGSFLTGRKARGTSAAPTAVQNGDGLLSLSGRGYGTTGFGFNGGATIGMRATENYTDTAMGSLIQFFTTPNGTTTLTPRMTIDQSGFVGIGTAAPNGMLDIARNGTTNVFGTSYGGQGSGFKARAANGTSSAPTATLLGDELAEFTAAGHDGTGFLEGAGWAAFAAENWTSTAHGTAMAFFATPLAASDAQLYMAILPNGNVGINPQQFDANEFPIVNDKLQVYGDIRVGDSGTNGCVKRFDGTGLAGVCSSDRRLKKNIMPFAPMLDKVTALQPVHYFWRSDEFPDRHFGNSRSYGLIAQDVEQVLPELVATDGDGYKAVDYSKLPLLTIQAMKELKAENDELKQEVAELKRLMNQLLASTRR